MRIPLSLPPHDRHSIDVVTVGQNSMDLIAVVDPYPPRNSKQQLRSWAQLPGGEAATAAVALARLGWRAAYVGRFGSDDVGRSGIESLAREGVAVDRVVRCANASSRFAVILVARDTGERTVLWDRHPAMTMEAEDVPDEAIAGARLVLVDAHETAVATSVAERARRMDVRTVVDIEHPRAGVDQLLREIDVIIAAESFPCAFTGLADAGAALRVLQEETGAAVVCVTLGDQGSLARCNGIEIRTPAFPVDVIDTTGCGDVFRAGFVAGWLEQGDGAEIERCLQYANAVAGLNCRALGARTAAPARAEVEDLLRSRVSFPK